MTPTMLTFTGTTPQCVSVETITDDAITEGNQTFTINFVLNTDMTNVANVTISPNSTTVTIQDNDG